MRMHNTDRFHFLFLVKTHLPLRMRRFKDEPQRSGKKFGELRYHTKSRLWAAEYGGHLHSREHQQL
jgi:hypothetical protein